MGSPPGRVDSDRLLTTRDVAAFLGVSPETVPQRWPSCELPGYRLGTNVRRFRESEIEEWLGDRFHPPKLDLDREERLGSSSRSLF